MQIYQPNSNIQPHQNTSPSKSRTNAHVSVVKNESTSSQFTTNDTQTTSITPSQQIVINCSSVSPVISTMFNVDEIDSYSHKPNSIVNVVHVSSNDETTYKFTTNAKANISPEIASEQTTVASNAANVILLKIAKGVAVSSDKKLAARIFFDEGSQRSYVRSGFAAQLGLNSISCELLSVSGFGGTVAQHNYGVTEIGLETPQGIEHVRVLITEEIIQPLDHSGYSQFKSHPRLQGLTLANDFEEDKFIVDILLGADAAYRFLGEIIQDHSQPLIKESHFGDVLYGPWLTTAIIGNHAIKDSEVVTKYIVH